MEYPTVRTVANAYDAPNLRVRLYNWLRLIIFPINWLVEVVGPLEGTVVCVGCGYGIIETILAIKNSQANFVASDVNAGRIVLAQSATKHVDNISFRVGDATRFRYDSPVDAACLIDLLHHLKEGNQVNLLDKIWRIVRPGGKIIIKDVDTSPRWKYYWNHLHDRLMAGLPLTYKPSSFYLDYFTHKGAMTDYSRPESFHSPYNHYLLIAVKPG